MRCKSGHDHSKKDVWVAANNPTEPRGRRPFHCEECSYYTENTTDNWEPYSIEKAKLEK